jgi:hypothetical protein
MSINTDELDINKATAIIKKFLSNISDLEYGSTTVSAVVNAKKVVEISFSTTDKKREEELKDLLNCK